MDRIGTTRLEFDPQLNRLTKRKHLRDGLSVVVLVGDTLWVANDETISLECLARQPDSAAGALSYSEHRQFALNDYLRLPVPPADPDDLEEVDVEGLDYDPTSGYLWLVGSHSSKRGTVTSDDANDPVERNLARLATVRSDGNRFLLARIPVVERDGTSILAREGEHAGKKRRAAQLRGDDTSSDLMRALKHDEHLRPFFAIPGKDNGFDIEGLAVVGERLLLGLRGPVLRGWTVILEVEPNAVDGDPSTLQLKKIGPGGRRYRKHFLQLGGLGIRDLCRDGPDLLILAGPTMDLDGPVTVFRWREGAQSTGERFVYRAQVPPILELPFGMGPEAGMDHAEGMTLFAPVDGDTRAVLVVYDSACDGRKQEMGTVEADIFALPDGGG